MARIASLWVANAMYRQVLKSVALAAVGFYLVERVQKQKAIDDIRSRAYEQSNRPIAQNGEVSRQQRENFPIDR